MSDEVSYRHAQGQINRLPCVFARAVGARLAVCELAVRNESGCESGCGGASVRDFRGGARAGVACAQPVARTACAQMAALLREKSRFALKQAALRPAITGPLSLRVQCGGLAGLKSVVDPATVAPDVHRLVRLAQERYGALADLPFQEIVKGVAAWRNGF